MSVLVAIVTSTCVFLFTSVAIAAVCWKYPSCRSRSFWDHNVKKVIRKIHAKCHKEKKEDKMQLVAAPAICRSSKVQAPFVVPQIFVDYGSRRTSCASDTDRRISLSSNNSSRRTSFASDSDRRGSASSYCSRRTSLASDTDRRGSASSFYSRRTSLASDTDRRGSASSRSSKRDSDIKSEDIEMIYGDLSDSDINFVDDICRSYRFEMLEEEKEEGAVVSPSGKRSLSLAEIGKDGKGTASLDGTPCKKPPLKRRGTLSSLVVSSFNTLEHSLNPSAPGQQQYMRKKQKVTRQNVIGLPDSPFLMHDLNLEEMIPRYAPPVKPAGQLKLQLSFSDEKTSLNIFIIEAQDLVVLTSSQQPPLNPFVKGFLVPGRTVKFNTKTVYKTKNPVFLEKFSIQELSPVDFTDNAALEFQVYSSEGRGRRHLLGVCSVCLKEIDNLTDGKANLPLMPQAVLRLHQGDIRISGCYQPVAGKMVFNVIEAKNIPKVTLVGTVNPYVKVEMYVNGLREAKHKTKVRQNLTDPAWHHQCVFDINRENPKLLGHVFVFSMMHKDMMTGAHRIGKVELGWSSHGEQLSHWYEIMEHPHRPADHWHAVIKESKISS